jgi:hypothetical protein
LEVDDLAPARGAFVPDLLGRGILRLLEAPLKISAALRDHLARTRGRSVDRRRLRYLEAILDLDRAAVDGWLADPSRRIWEGR